MTDAGSPLGIAFANIAPIRVERAIDPIASASGREIVVVDSSQFVVTGSRPTVGGSLEARSAVSFAFQSGTRFDAPALQRAVREPGVTPLVHSGVERVATFAPVFDGRWAVYVIDTPQISLRAERDFAAQLDLAYSVALVVAAILAAAIATLVAVLRRQQLTLENARTRLAGLNAELSAASRHKSAFLANMSHELRTPLNAVIGFSDVLLQKMPGELNERQAEYVLDIRDSGKHLLSLINEVLDLSKVEAGKIELRPHEFSLQEAARDVHALVQPLASQKRQRLTLDSDGELPLLFHDQGRVKQVLLNLLSNAVKFTPEEGTITTRLAAKDGLVDISVTDTGVGIAAEDLPSLFEEFKQLKAGERQQGTGLGLALARRLTTLMGGDIAVASEPGKGSTFTVRLPVRMEENVKT